MTHTRQPRRLAAIGAGLGSGLLALALVGPGAVLALVSDSGTHDIKVPDRAGYASADVGAGFVEYIGDQNVTYGPAGTGTFDSFVRVQNDGSERGYNTNGTLQFDTKAGKWTHAIKVSDIPIISVLGVPHWELFADINDSNSTPWITLNDLEVWFANSATITGYPFAAPAEKKYDFNGAIQINDVNQGSGRGDLRYLVPTAEMGIPANCGYKDPLCSTWFVLYSQWGASGGAYTSDGGFEEWKVKQYPYVVVDKTAVPTYTQTYHWTIDKSVDKALATIAEGGTATFNYTVAVNHDKGVDSAWAVGGTITIANPGREPAIITSVADQLSGVGAVAASCGVTFPYTLPAGGTLSCTYSVAVPDATTRTNVATVTLDYGGLFTDTATATFGAPTTVIDECITVTDTFKGALGTACVGETMPKVFTYSRDVSGVPGTCTTYDNTATFKTNDTGATGSDSVTVKVCVGQDLTVTKTAEGTYDRLYLWKIDKNADKTSVKIAAGGSYTFNYAIDVAQTGFTDSGWEVHGVITVANPNDWEAISLSAVGDVVDNGGSCSVAAGPWSVPAKGTLAIKYTCSYATQPPSYSGTNTAGVVWDKALYSTPTGAASGSAAFTLARDVETNKTVHVTDTYAGPLGTVTATDAMPYATKTFTYPRTESGVAGSCTKYDNTATITETGQFDKETVELCVAKDLTVKKTAVPTFTRTYAWEIAKGVDQSYVEIMQGGSATFTYTVAVKHDAGKDSAWKVAGTITIANPNDWQAITLTSLADVVDNGGVCTVDAGPYTIPKSGSITVGYVCTYGVAPSPVVGVNTATATWDKAAYVTPSGSASGTAAADFSGGPTKVVDECIKVSDTYAGPLGTVCVGDANPTTFTYTRTITPDLTGTLCGTFTYDNTASFVTNDTLATGSDSQTVTIEVLCNEGCTPGYWKNHPESWVGYTTGQTVESVFDVPDAYGLDNDTLMTALGYPGGEGDVGAAQTLLRAGVAAVLNAAHPEIAYPLTQAQVIARVNAALASGSRADMLALARLLDGYNNYGCHF